MPSTMNSMSASPQFAAHNENAAGFDVVTGAFGYTGGAIARKLQASGGSVRTLTGHPNRPELIGGALQVAPLDFDDPASLQRNLEGADVLYNTYWIRFPYRGMTFERAVENSRILIEAAQKAGVRRLIHISISNPSKDSPLGYFRGKAAVERAIRESGISYAILRPTVIFGPGDILINNIAWFLRRFPLFAVPNTGESLIQPVFIEDIAEIAVHAGAQFENIVEDVVGPETFTFEGLVRLIAKAVHSRAAVLRMGRGLLAPILQVLGRTTGDVVLTQDELDGLAANLLVSKEPPLGRARISEWLDEYGNGVGQHYASELRRHYSRTSQNRG